MRNNTPLVSIVTVCYNSGETIEDTIKSIVMQSYKNIEYIIVDGKSTDNTDEIVDKYKEKSDLNIVYISEKDNGLYDAMNKGISMANGDIIGILNSDDMYIDENVINDIVNKFNKEDIELVYGDLVFVDQIDINQITRKWVSKKGNFKFGWAPPHPTVFVKSKLYKVCGNFNTKYKIAADYDLLYRFLEKYKAKTGYVNRIIVKMRNGGESTRNIKSNIVSNKEVLDLFKEDGYKFGIITVFMKLIRKVPQYIIK